ncbi:MAG: 3-methyl-2-oxobutanoate hydroxymethyltransferase [Elusimicrobia bacterium RIFOXYB2_FULL_50_12]|nr:MAG: 3-methyl-2-oxobutanoate hydroxymethyltransferase [Elusimicrobia bacterium RIFOXYB2_FULL_50_12]
MEKITTVTLRQMKERGEKIVMLTGYDFSMTKLLNEAGVEAILVGDSLGMVKLGYETTLPVTVDDIIYHCKAVKRGNSRSLIIADMPFMSYEAGVDEAIANAGKVIKEGGAEAVKIEGGREMAAKIQALVAAKIPVMGHIGLTPQSINQLGGYKVQGRSLDEARRLVDEARVLEAAGVFAIVLECIPAAVAVEITKAVSVPTIGIGAGGGCDGQILVTDDMLGLYGEFKPKFVKRYADLRSQIVEAIRLYRKEVKEAAFPSDEHTY